MYVYLLNEKYKRGRVSEDLDKKIFKLLSVRMLTIKSCFLLLGKKAVFFFFSFSVQFFKPWSTQILVTF